MANTNTNYLPKLLAMGQMALRENAIMTHLVSRDYQGEAQKKGAVINVPIPSAVTATDVTPGPAAASNQDFSPSNVAMTLDFWKESTFQLSDKDEREVHDQTVPMQASEAIKSLGNAIDSYILGKHVALYSAAGSAGTTPFATNIAVANTARKLLNKELAPLDDRRVVLDPDAEANALGLSNILQFDQRGDQGGIIRGVIGHKLGMDWFMDQNVPEYTPGTGWREGFIASTVAGAVGDTTLNIINATASGTVLVGDIFAITATGQQHVITAAATASSTVAFTVEFQPPLKTAVATGATIEPVSDAYTANLVFHRDCFAWASRPLADQNGYGNAILSRTDPVSGVALRLEVSRQYKQTTHSFDVLGGAQCIRRELGAKIFGE